MSFKWINFLDLAELLASPATTLITQAYYRTSISRAYYAVYWISREHAERHGLGVPIMDSHKVVRDYYLNSSDISYNEIGEDLKRLWKKRKDADYDMKTTFGPQAASWNITAAKLTIDKLKRIGATV